MKPTLSGVAAALTLAALAASVPAPAATVTVRTVALLDLQAASTDAAVGLLVPAWGDTTSRQEALAALLAGAADHPLLRRSRPPVIDVLEDGEPDPPGCCDVRILLELPPPRPVANDVRYAVAIHGAGFRGLLYSPSTRIRGLVSIADLAPTVLRLEGRPVPDGVQGRALSWRPSEDAAGELRELDDRLAATRDARLEATAGYAAFGLALVLAALAVRSPFAGRAALYTLPAGAAASLALSLAGVARWWVFVAVTAALALGSAAGARSRTAAGAILTAVLGFHYAVLLWDGEAVSLSLLGPNPDAGGRFYGLSNELETILAGTALVAAALLWERLGIGALIGVGGLAIVTVAPGRLGASVTGAIVVVVGLAVLALDLERRRGLLVTAVVAAAGAAALLAASPAHLSHASPGRLADRLELSARLSVDSLQAILLAYVFGLGVLLAVALRYRALRAQLEPSDAAVLLALLVASAVSAAVNDSPAAVLAHGAAWCLTVTAWALAGSGARGAGASYRLAPVCLGPPSSRLRRWL